MDNSGCHNGQRVSEKMTPDHMTGFDHAPYSPDLSPRDLWLLRFLKIRMKENRFRNVNDVEDFVCNLGSEVTLAEVQLVFQEWMRRAERVSEHNEEHIPE
jgi:hypothetical protein